MSISSMDEFEDQDDEEELLQRALEEQAQRDLNYSRPPNHPPPVISPAAAGPPMRHPPPSRQPPPPAPQPRPQRPPPPPQSQRGRPPPAQEDDESDVELLSLSSEDEEEDSHSRRRLPEAHRAPVRDDDQDWDEDDDEPDSWKRVDESELSRMVREMRETRLTAIPNLRKAPTYKRKSSAVTEAFLRGDDFMDPLGLGVVDTRHLTLVTDNSVSPKSEGVDGARDPSSREKMLYHSEKFDPKYFLCRIHQNTSHVDLEAGGESLKVDLQNRKEQLKQLVKENFDCFVSCKNTIDDIHSKLQQIEHDIEGGGTVLLSNAIHEVDKVANQAFGPLFERQVQAERIRSVQGMLQRFRTLFNLPSTIRAYITKGEYDLAIREYKKAKSLVLPTHVRILKRVLEEVDKVIAEFKDKMYKLMDDPNVEFSELESTVRLLLELEPGSDPVWHYINVKNMRIRGLLDSCSVEHEERLEELQSQMHAKAQSDARWSQLLRESNKASDVDFLLLLGDNEKDNMDATIQELTDEQSDSLQSRLIRRLTAVVVQHVPSFWQLALVIFNGRFAKVSQGSSANASLDSQSKHKATVSGQQVPNARGSDILYDKRSLDEVVAMVIEILSLYESKVLNAFLALKESNVTKNFMRRAVEEVSKACGALESKDAAPASAVQVLRVLNVQVTCHFVLRLCAFMLSATIKIIAEEDWVPVSAIERSDSHFAISSLPLRFRGMLVSTFGQIEGLVEKLKPEASEVHNIGGQIEQMQESIKETVFKCFHLFRDMLDKASIDLSQQCEALESEMLKNGHAPEDQFSGLQVGLEIANPHQKLLVILSNLGYCTSSILASLVRKYKQTWLPFGKAMVLDDNGPSIETKIVDAFSISEERILGQYTRAKATLIGTAAAAYFLEDGIQWGAAPPVKGIRDAAIELLHPLVAVHAELYAGSKPYLEKALSILVEGLMDALLDVFNQNKFQAMRVVDLNGSSQIALELNYLEAVLQAHLTEAAYGALNSLRDQLREKVLETLREAETLGHRRSTRAEEGSVLEERLQASTMSADELHALEQQVCADFLKADLKRTRLNTVCFTDGHELRNVESGLEGGSRFSHARSTSTAGAILNHKAGLMTTSRHRRWLSGSSLSDSESGKPSPGLPPQSPLSQSGYASSDLGSETGGSESRAKSSGNNERYARETRRPRRAAFGATDDDLR